MVWSAAQHLLYFVQEIHGFQWGERFHLHLGKPAPDGIGQRFEQGELVATLPWFFSRC